MELVGLVTMVGVLIGLPAWLTLTVNVLAALIPCVCPLRVYRRLGRNEF